MPASRIEYWEPKLKRNQIRDRENQARLEEQGWKVFVVWECGLENPKPLATILRRFLGRP
jgi:DNA mismatch endonuclease, patch repair protein